MKSWCGSFCYLDVSWFTSVLVGTILLLLFWIAPVFHRYFKVSISYLFLKFILSLRLLFFPRYIVSILGLPPERDKKNSVRFHVATLSSAHRKSGPKLKLGPDVLHSIVIEVMGLACQGI